MLKRPTPLAVAIATTLLINAAVVASRATDTPKPIDRRPRASRAPVAPVILGHPPKIAAREPIAENGRLAFVRIVHVENVDGAIPERSLFVADSEGRGAERIADVAWDVAWAPFGNLLVYSGAGGLYAHELTEGTRRRLVACSAACDGIGSPAVGGPGWSRVAFSAEFRGRNGIWLRRGLGSDAPPPELVLAGQHVAKPVWSPDGRFLLVKRGYGEPPGQELVFINARTGRVRAAVPIEGINLLDTPEWSPDGRRLVAAATGRLDGGGGVRLYLLRLDGSVIRPLTRCEADGCTDYDPTWSPDGRSVLFTRYPGYASDEIWSDGFVGDVMAVDVETGETRHLTLGPTPDCCAAWEPSLPDDV